MARRLPYLALGASLAFLVAAVAVGGKLCFDQLRKFPAEMAKVGPMQAANPAWVVATADEAVERLWWLCLAVGLGILLTALSALWLALSRRPPTA